MEAGGPPRDDRDAGDEPGSGEQPRPQSPSGPIPPPPPERPAEPAPGDSAPPPGDPAPPPWEEEPPLRTNPPTTGSHRASGGDPREPTTAERRQLAERRKRHRDLPAKVRRRQAIALAVIVLIVGFGLFKLVGAIFGSDEKSSPAEQVPVEKLVGQTIVGKVPASGPDKSILARIRNGRLGGVIVNPRNAKTLTADAAKMQQAAAEGGNPPLMIAIDQEGGPVKRLKGPPEQSPAQIGKAGDEDLSRTEGENTGKFLAGLGVNVDFAPVADVAHPGSAKTLTSRTFGSDPGEVAPLVSAFAEGLDSGGVAATVKHFPGLGYSKNNTDFGAAKIGQTREELEADFEPFKAAIEAGAPLVMTSTATYVALDPKNPAGFSPAVINDELREGLGFNGVVISDDLEGTAVRKQLAPAKAALRTLLAGGDMVLFATGAGTSDKAFKTLSKAAASGTLSREVLESANERIADLKDGFGG